MDLRKKVRDFVLSLVDSENAETPIGDDDSLIQLEVLDSMAILELMSFFDENFDITPSDDELYPDNFDSINLILAFIERKMT